MKYSHFRDRVKAEAGKRGLNIHTISGKLGMVINTLELLRYDRWVAINAERAQKAKDRARRSLVYLGGATGIHINLEDLEL